MTDTPSKPPGAAAPSRWQQISRWGAYLIFLVLSVFVVTLVYLGFSVVPAGAWALGVRAVVVVIAGLLPAMIYNYFIRGRGRILYREYQQNLRRLGIPEAAEQYREKFEAIYGPMHLNERAGLRQGAQAQANDEPQPDQRISPWQSPIMVATLFSLLGWLLTFFPLAPTDWLSPNPNVVVYGFLGAYVFGISSLVRQYVTDDLQPRYYASLTVRYLSVLVLSWLVSFMASPTPVDDFFLNSQERAQLLAFTIGLFPAIGLRAIQRLSARLLGTALFRGKDFDKDPPLGDLEGLTIFQEDRLLLEGIENQQNLVCANIVDLMLKTRFPVEQLIDWMDQALLRLHAGKRIDHFLGCGLRAGTDFLDIYDAVEPPSDPQPPDNSLSTQVARRRQLAEQLDSQCKPEDRPGKTLSLLDNMATALRSDPNMFHIRYWRSHIFEALPDDVERLRVSADLKLMQNLPDEAIAIYNELLRRFPGYLSAYLYRGLARFNRREYVEALTNYQTAIDFSGLQWSNDRYVRLELGRLYRHLEQDEQAVETYETVLKHFPDFNEARFELASLLMTRLTRYEDAIQQYTRVIQNQFNVAEALANRGVARYENWKKQGRQAATRDKELNTAREDLQLALRYRPSLSLAYINLALLYKDLGMPAAQEQILNDALTQFKKTSASDAEYRARLERGNLYLQLNRAPEAVDDFSAAAQIFSQQATPYIFQSIAYRRLDRLDEAVAVLDQAAELDPRLPALHIELVEVADLAWRHDDAARAADLHQLALNLMQDNDEPLARARANLGLSRISLQQNQLEAARAAAHRAVKAAEGRDDQVYTDALYQRALTLVALDEKTLAARDFATCALLYDTLGQGRLAVCALYQRAQVSPDLKVRRNALEAAQKKMDSVLDVFNPEDAQLRKDILALMETLKGLSADDTAAAI